MSRQTVRAAVTTFLTPPAVPGLNKVFSSEPKRVEGTWFRYGQPAGTLSGAVGIVNLSAETEERIGIAGEHYGRKWVHYDVELEIRFHSLQKHAEDAMADFDNVVDAVKDKLRSDRRLDNYPVIFESGERQLSAVYGEPVVNSQDGSTMMACLIQFEVSEVLST